ncbi:hypothetical protein [Fibrella forsythiae]|uniref:XRE family transcriptional regulator n=1 Tax=Fibrella forsythiae TaxID=2817061 RepID=A0ABS3JT90_9BACT|nr:hypothetical protein [Fibrella forsythiae]MBO0953235.1 hypothetical protein [Fibrella forsythiae]
METVKEIKAHLRQGDWERIAQLTGLKYHNAYKTFERPTAKRHKDVVKAAREVALFNKRHGFCAGMITNAITLAATSNEQLTD